MKGTDRAFMTAYQIYKRLIPAAQDRLAEEYGQSGKDAGHPYSRATQVDADLVRTIHGFDALLVLTGSTASANL